jgi:hypothetical protein
MEIPFGVARFALALKAKTSSGSSRGENKKRRQTKDGFDPIQARILGPYR